jgi:uncharacterized membrane protein
MLGSQKVVSPVGRARRVTGIILVALGAVLSARVVWLGAFYGSGFGHDEWVRFGGLLWLGAALALAGCWLAYRSRVAAWALALAVLALFLMAYVHDRWLR